MTGKAYDNTDWEEVGRPLLEAYRPAALKRMLKALGALKRPATS
jgi:hypothetical protein